MHVISVDGVSASVEGRVLFDGVSFGVSTGDRTGVVGRNGAGKSTLLRIVAGVDVPAEGRVVVRSDARVAFLAQEPELDPDATPLSLVAAAARQAADASTQAWEVDVQVRATLERLGVGGALAESGIGSLSGGQRRRVALATVLAAPADVLVLDEPTNHLDADTVDWLEGALRAHRGGIVLVTHDRYLLDRLATRILEVEGGRVHRHDGTYADMLDARAAREEHSARGERRRRNILRKEVAWLRRGAKARTSKPRFRLEQVRRLMDAGPAKEDGVLDLGTGRNRLGSDAFELQGVVKSFGDRTVLREVDMILAPGDRAGVVGPNGSGKTTLLRLLAGELDPDAGRVRVGRTVVVGHYRQDSTIGRSDDARRVIEVVTDVAQTLPLADGTFVSAARLAERFGFDAEMQQRRVSVLSGGERRRLALLRVLIEGPNVLLLDEPTNDLDVDTLTVLEDHLDTFRGVLVVASHDRFLLDRLTDVFYGVDPDGGVRKYPGDWDEYRERRRSQAAAVAPRSSAPERGRSTRKLSYAQQRELQRTEREVASLSREREELEQAMAAAATDHEALLALGPQLDSVSAALDAAEERWLELTVLAEDLADD